MKLHYNLTAQQRVDVATILAALEPHALEAFQRFINSFLSIEITVVDDMRRDGGDQHEVVS